MADGRERIVIVKLVIKIMWVWLWWRPMLLTVIVCVTAFRAERQKKKMSMHQSGLYVQRQRCDVRKHKALNRTG